MKTSSCKAKGRKACKEVADLLLKYAPELKVDDVRVTSSGATGEDILMSPFARSIYPFTIEVKNQESLNIWSALNQAKQHLISASQIPNKPNSDQSSVTPVLCFRRNRSLLYISMEMEDFLKLFRRNQCGQTA